MKTITFKLYNLSRRKSEIIDCAMENYTRAFQYLIDCSEARLESLESAYKAEKGRRNSGALTRWINGQTGRELNRFNVEPFKDSLRFELGMILAGYFKLLEVRPYTGFPLAWVSDKDYEFKYRAAVQEADYGLTSLRELDRRLDRLIRKNTALKPIFFCRYAVNRDYCLLYDAANDRYYAKLYLMNAKNEYRQYVQPAAGKELRYIHKNGGILKCSGRKERFILVPLSFGKWQEHYLKIAMESPEILKTARLVKKGSDYYLSVSMDTGMGEKLETEAFLGVSRGLGSCLHYTLADGSGEIIDHDNINTGAAAVLPGQEPAGSMYKPADNEIHVMANSIVRLAVEHRAKVILEDLNGKGDRLSWRDGNGELKRPFLDRSCYNRLSDILEYKLEEKGLQRPVRVSPYGIFHTCCECGQNILKNRFSKELFICTVCGTAMDIDTLGSTNLARKLVEYSRKPVRIGVLKDPQGGVRMMNTELELDFRSYDPSSCQEELRREVDRIIREFYDGMGTIVKDQAFKRKYSLIRKFESADDPAALVQFEKLEGFWPES